MTETAGIGCKKAMKIDQFTKQINLMRTHFGGAKIHDTDMLLVFQDFKGFELWVIKAAIEALKKQEWPFKPPTLSNLLTECRLAARRQPVKREHKGCEYCDGGRVAWEENGRSYMANCKHCYPDDLNAMDILTEPRNYKHSCEFIDGKVKPLTAAQVKENIEQLKSKMAGIGGGK